MSLAVDEENIESETPEKPCSGLRKELKECILASDCVKKVGLCLTRLNSYNHCVCACK